MKLSCHASQSLTLSNATLVLPVFEGDDTILSDFSGKVSASFFDLLSKVVKDEFNAALHTIRVVDGQSEQDPNHIILYGLGKKDELELENIRDMGGNISRCPETLNCHEMSFYSPQHDLNLALFYQTLTEGIVMGGYEFEGYQSKKKESKRLAAFHVFGSGDPLEALERGVIIGKAVNVARDLGNTPANILTPAEFMKRAKSMSSLFSKLKIEVIDEKKAKSLGMGAFLSVGQGSNEPSYMVVMRYNGGTRGEKPLALVGKGVTFDTGGISIKPSKGMGNMKGDMAGAAAVFAAMTALIELKPKRNVMAVLGLAENMPSGTAIRPGDVVTAMNGKSIEITNTDAEGRMVLADALSYVVKEGAGKIIDIATLTGACSVALGDIAAAILGNDQDFIDDLLDSAARTGERLWQLPLYKEYLEYLKSDVADMINANENRLAGACSAAKFLEQFVDDVPWAHLDIASIRNASKTKGAMVKGIAGFGVRQLIDICCKGDA